MNSIHFRCKLVFSGDSTYIIAPLDRKDFEDYYIMVPLHSFTQLLTLSCGVLAAPAHDPALHTRTATEVWLSRRQTQCTPTQKFGCCNTDKDACTVTAPFRASCSLCLLHL